jgi:hypothetical protein
MAAASALSGFSRSAVMCVLSSFLTTPCAAQTIASTFRAGDARPVKRFATRDRGAAEINLLSFDFQQPAYGFEGAGLLPLDGEPSRGARYIVSATVYGEKAIATAAFSAVDERGTVIQSIRMMRDLNTLDTSELVGLMFVPDRPFRIVMTGAALDGVSYRCTYARLFRPTQRPPAGPRLPANTPPDMAERMTQTADEGLRRIIDTLESEMAKQPDGVVMFPRTMISNVAYAPLFSAAGHPIGLRVTYDLRFFSDGYYNPALHVLPTYQRDDLRGLIEMHVVEGSIDPLPTVVGTPQQQTNILAYGAGYQYTGGTTYRFTADLIPDFIIQNEAKTKFCIYSRKHLEIYPSVEKRAAWTQLLTSKSPTTYKIWIGNSDFDGTIDGFSAPGTFRASFATEGAHDCGSQPTRRF